MGKSDVTTRVAFCIYGLRLDFEAISKTLELIPTHTHRQGDSSPLKGRPYPCDLWEISSPLSTDAPLDVHLKWMAEKLRPHYAYILSLKSPDTSISIFWGYTTENEQNDFSISPEALEIFVTLGIPLEVSILAT